MNVAMAIARRVIAPRPDCQIWSGTTNEKGYGRIRIGGTKFRVHRVAWELVNGPIPDGLTVDHLCRIKSCVNPEHMELVTAIENNRRALRYRGAYCRNGHEMTPENTGITSRGWRRCRTCDTQGRERRKAARTAP